MSNYIVFTRTWWRWNENWPDGKEPHAGEKSFVKGFNSEGDAQEFCQFQNSQLPVTNPLSFKYEYTSTNYYG